MAITETFLTTLRIGQGQVETVGFTVLTFTSFNIWFAGTKPTGRVTVYTGGASQTAITGTGTQGGDFYSCYS